MKEDKRFSIATILVIFICTVVTVAFDLGTTETAQWQMLAQAFLHGRTFFLQVPAILTDSVLWNGHYYWPLGPFPAVLLMPFMAAADFLKMPFNIGGLQLVIVALIFWLVYRLARKFFSQDDAGWFAIAFTFASAFLWIAVSPRYGYFPYTITVAAIFAAILEYTGKKRWWLIGLFMAIAVATRTTAGLGILFFIGDITLVCERSFREKLKSLVKLLIPFGVSVILLGVYNYLRFGDPFQAGYSLQILTNPALSQARDYGLFNLIHIPGNLYYFFLAAPLPVLKDSISQVLTFPFIKANPWGMGIIFVSPYLLYLFLLSYKDRISRLLIATSIIIAIPIFTYYGIGIVQLGYRYALDFMPFVYFLFMRNYSAQYGPLSGRLKWLIALSALLDLYLVFTLIFFSSVS
jgi:hypothetical protein